MTFSLQRLPEPLLLEQAVLDPTWNKFKTVMVVIGGILVFWVFGEKMFLWGRAGQPVPAPAAAIYQTVMPPPVTTPSPAVQQMPAPSGELTAEELDRYHSEHLRSRGR